jgi:DNA repair protein RadC
MNINEFASELKKSEQTLNDFFAVEYLQDKDNEERELLAYIFMNTSNKDLSKKVLSAYRSSGCEKMRFSLLGDKR